MASTVTVSRSFSARPSGPVLLIGLLLLPLLPGWAQSGSSGNGGGPLSSQRPAPVARPAAGYHFPAAPSVLQGHLPGWGGVAAPAAPAGMLRPGAACLSESFDSFAGGASVTLASGVVATGLGIYPTASSAGAAPNSAQFNSTNDQLETPALSGTATSLSFFIKGNGTDAASSLLVEGYTGSAYVPIATIQPLPTSATTLTYDASSVPSLAGGTYTRFRFTYAKSNGNLAFDDLAVSCSPASPSTRRNCWSSPGHGWRPTRCLRGCFSATSPCRATPPTRC